jgi:epoxide hydrolase 4
VFAIRRLRPITRLVILNVPHPKVGEREIRKWRQFWKSWYIFFFQIPWLPERLLLRKRANPIRQILLGADLDIYTAAVQRPGAMTAMINYYRALLRHCNSVDLGDARIDVPTLMIWGEEDVALNIGCTEGTEEWVTDFTLHRLPGISHWVQVEAPEEVNRIVGDWLDREIASG